MNKPTVQILSIEKIKQIKTWIFYFSENVHFFLARFQKLFEFFTFAPIKNVIKRFHLSFQLLFNEKKMNFVQAKTETTETLFLVLIVPFPVKLFFAELLYICFITMCSRVVDINLFVSIDKSDTGSI